MADPIRIEVEDFSVQTGFNVETLTGIASDDEALMVSYRSDGGPSEGDPITTSTIYAGPSGTFDINLGTFDESDGDSRIVVTIGGIEVADFILDQNPGSASPDSGTAVEIPIATGLAVSVGDQIEITVYRDGGEYVRLDYLDLVSQGTGGTPTRLEIEDFDTKPDSFAIEALAGIASGDEALRVDYHNQGGPGEGDPVTTSTTYDGPSGTFDINLGTFDESDGDSRIVVTIGGVEVADFVLDQNPGSAAPDASTAVERQVAVNFGLSTGDLIEITVYRDGGEYVRLDYLDLVPIGIATGPIGPVSDTDPSANAVAEGSGAGTLVGIMALATDPDAGDTVSYAIDDTRFEIDAAGVVTVAGGAVFDAGGEPSIDVTVTATSSDTSSSQEVFTIAVAEPLETQRLEVEDFDNKPAGFAVESLAGVASGDEALMIAYGSQGGPGEGEPITTSTIYDGPGGLFNVLLGAFDESDGNSQVVVRIAGEEVANFLLDENPAGDAPALDNAVIHRVATGHLINPGDLIEITVSRDDLEYVRLDYLDLDPVDGELGPPPVAFKLGDLDGKSGLRMDGVEAGDRFGSSVAIAGDVNDDGLDDFIIGAARRTSDGNTLAGGAYVVFGRDGPAGDGFLPILDPASLDGSNGFRLDGADMSDFAGGSVDGAGDINGDGIDDLVISATGADLANPFDDGASYVVFGRDVPGGDAFAASIDLASLDGTTGFRINGEGTDEADRFGTSVSRAGDINGDGFDDLAIGAEALYPYRSEQGITYVFFGRDVPGGDSFASTIEASALDGTTGFRLHGSITDVTDAGDINGDGIDDLAIGAGRAGPGEVHVVFGQTGGFAADIDLSTLNGSTGFRLRGESSDDGTGTTVSAAGDINGDGIGDLIIGAFRDAPPVERQASEMYVVFGRDVPGGASFASSIDLASLDGTNGFRLLGDAKTLYSGGSVGAAGDFNGDGIDDIVLTDFASDKGYVVFGRDVSAGPGFMPTLELAKLDETTGLRLDDLSQGNNSVAAVAGGGDVNGDGFSDVILGDSRADPDGSLGAGSAFVIFGGPAGPGSAIPGYNETPDTGMGHFAITENAALGTVVGTIEAIDGNVEDTLSFAITDGNDDGLFVIDVNGLITVAGIADHENGQGRVLTVEVTDSRGYVARTTATVAFRDQADGLFPTDGLDLSNIDGANGFRLTGVEAYDQAGYSVSDIGDFNGDGISDVIVGSQYADIDGVYGTGASYIVFGRDVPGGDSFAATIPLSSLNGSTGFRLDGVSAGDGTGRSVSGAGDVNGDGLADVIIGSPRGPINGTSTGGAFVVFGQPGGFDATFDLSGLDGTSGFRLDGVNDGDRTGWSVSGAGDVNGDGVDDVIVGAFSADPDGTNDAGAGYVVFGNTSGFAASIDLSALDGSTGFRIDGPGASDLTGWSVSGAGDVNGDGLADVIVGTLDTDDSYVVFGSSSGFSANIDLSGLDGSIGFRLVGALATDGSGRSVSRAGDINDDGIDDLLIGAPGGSPDGRFGAGQTYVLFGNSGGFASNIDLSTLDGSTGFRINGVDQGDSSGRFVAAAGDINGDGIDDLIIGARYADPDGKISGGESYVLFGSSDGFAASVDLSTLNGSSGFRLDGAGARDYAGQSVSGAGDINGDGLADLIIGAHGADPNAQGYAGETYVVFAPSSIDKVLPGTEEDDLLVGGLGDDTLTGMTGDDWFVISEGDDIITDFTPGEDTIGLEGLFSGVAPGDIGDFVELTTAGPDALFSFDEDGAGDFTAGGREGTLTLDSVDLTGSTLADLLDDGTLWLG